MRGAGAGSRERSPLGPPFALTTIQLQERKSVDRAICTGPFRVVRKSNQVPRRRIHLFIETLEKMNQFFLREVSIRI